MRVEVLDIFSGDDIDFGIPVGIERIKRVQLLELLLGQIRKIGSERESVWLVAHIVKI